MRKTGHFDPAFLPVGLARQYEAQHLRGLHGIRAVGLIEVAHPVQQHRFRVLSLHLEELPDQRGIFGNLDFLGFLAHNLQSYKKSLKGQIVMCEASGQRIC